MELVFVHGFGFDASFWDALAALLPDYSERRIERGFLGASPKEDWGREPALLIGHSLGFMHGLRQREWAGWVAVNGFARFVPDCVPAAALRDMRMRLAADADRTLAGFYAALGAASPDARPDETRLLAALDELRDGNVEDLIGGFLSSPLGGESENLGLRSKSLVFANGGSVSNNPPPQPLPPSGEGLSFVPGLVLAARHDPLVSAAASEALAKAARAKLSWHETGGHILPQSDPAFCARAIADFILSLEI